MNALVKENDLGEFRRSLMSKKGMEQIRHALPEHITPEKFARTVITAATTNPDLLKADRGSLLMACLSAAKDGLFPDGKEAALVVFKTKADGRYIQKVQYLPMIRGLYKLARNSGEVSVLSAHVVHENDLFDCSYGFETDVVHKRPPLGHERGEVIGAYAVAVLKDGSRDFEVMDLNELNKIRNKSRSRDSGPWVEWTDEMYRKTVMRRLLKRIPMSEDVARAVERDNAFYELESRREGFSGTTETIPVTASERLALLESGDDEDDVQVGSKNDGTPEDFSPWCNASIENMKSFICAQDFEEWKEANAETLARFSASCAERYSAFQEAVAKRRKEVEA